MTSINIFEKLLKTTRPEISALCDFMVNHPVLFSLIELEKINDWVVTLSSSEQPKAMAYLKAVFEVRNKSIDIKYYPSGEGPVEQLYHRVHSGEITLSQACELAAKENFYSLLSSLYIYKITKEQDNITLSAAVRAPEVVKFMHILSSAVDSLPFRSDDEFYRMHAYTIHTFLQASTFVLVKAPDYGLFNLNIKKGNAFIERFKHRSIDSNIALMMRRFGVLYFDTYFGRKGTNRKDYWARFEAWKKKGTFTNSQQPQFSMPAPEEALQKAIYYLEFAGEHETDTKKGMALKALAQAYNHQLHLFDMPVGGKLQKTISEALKMLVPHENFHVQVLELDDILSQNKGQTGKHSGVSIESVLANLLEQSPKELLNKQGDMRTLDAYMGAIKATIDKKPKTALELWIRMAQILKLHPTEERLISHYSTGLKILKQFIPASAGKIDGQEDPSDTFNRIIKQAQSTTWNNLQTFSAFLRIANYSHVRNSEKEGIQIIETLEELIDADESLNVFTELLSYCRLTLELNEAVSEIGSNNLQATFVHYFNALELSLKARLSMTSINLLERIYDLNLIDGDHEWIADETFRGMSHLKPLLETRLPEAVDLCQDIYKKILLRYSSHPNSEFNILDTLQVAKGFRYAAFLEGGIEKDLMNSPRVIDLLQRIDSTSKKVKEEKSKGLGQTFRDLIDDETLLASYLGMKEKKAGRTNADVLRNLQTELDNYINQLLVIQDVSALDCSLSRQDVWDSISDHTVLLHQFVGVSRSGKSVIYNVIITKGKIELVLKKTDSEHKHSRLGNDDYSAILGEFALETSNIRKSIKNSSNNLQDLLNPATQMLISKEVQAILNNYKSQGKNHLLICPHGALHFFPYHLLGEKSNLLSDHWTITYLPNLKLLDPQLKRKKGKSKKVVSFGITYKKNNPNQLPILENSENEARQISKINNGVVFINDSVTEEKVVDAMSSCSSVHISCHGQHKVNAPFFQCLYLTPTAKYDGILHAYELLNYDFSNLDLLTLSACETALGRFDRGDNITGLPSVFLLCGVKTIVGTLWEIDSNVSEFFFTSFYTELANGKTKIDAFKAAQQKSKTKYSAPRDWAAFYITGNPF